MTSSKITPKHKKMESTAYWSIYRPNSKILWFFLQSGVNSHCLRLVWHDTCSIR